MEDSDLSFGYIALEMPLRHSSGDVQQTFGSMGLEFGIEDCLGLRIVLEVWIWNLSTLHRCVRLHNREHR